MKVMVLVKATADSEAGVMPPEQLLKEMGDYNEELIKAGIILAGDGLKPSSEGVRIRFQGASRSVVDGPFAETKELVAGYWVWQVASMDEAIAWVKKCPNPMPGDSEIEIRPIFGLEDFGEQMSPELREREERQAAEVAGYQLQEPRWEVGAERIVAGPKRHFTAATRAEIPQLWCELEKARVGLSTKGADSFGVCWGSVEEGFDYLAGVEVSEGSPLPEGVEKATLPAQRYAIFTHGGDVTRIAATCDAIWNRWLPNSGHQAADAPFFERYTEEFDLETMSGGIELWIPIKG